MSHAITRPRSRASFWLRLVLLTMLATAALALSFFALSSVGAGEPEGFPLRPAAEMQQVSAPIGAPVAVDASAVVAPAGA